MKTETQQSGQILRNYALSRALRIDAQDCANDDRRYLLLRAADNIESLVEDEKKAIAQAPTLLKQRDELLAALVDAITELEQLAEAAGRLAEFGSFIDRQHAAIAKAGGKDGGK